MDDDKVVGTMRGGMQQSNWGRVCWGWAGSGWHDKRGWWKTQGKQAVDNATRGRRGNVRQVGGGRCKAIGRQTTWQEEGGGCQQLSWRRRLQQRCETYTRGSRGIRADLPLHRPGGIQDPRIVLLFFVCRGGCIAIANTGSCWCRQRRPAWPTSWGHDDDDNQPIGGPLPAPCRDAVKDGGCDGVLRWRRLGALLLPH